MTLADFLRKYLEERRRICEEKARFSDLNHDVAFFSKDGENASSSDTSNKKYFSNTLEKKPKDDTCVKCKKTQIQKNVRIVRRPDGKIETETIVKDADGNVEKTVTYQEGDKTYTTITTTDPQGNERVKYKISQTTAFSENSDGSRVQLPIQPKSDSNSDDDYDFWFNKFFGTTKPSQEFDGQDTMPFDFNNVEDNVNKLLKMFENDFPGTFKNQWSPNNDTENKDWFVEDLVPRLSDETSKIIEQFENGVPKSITKNNKKLGKKGERQLQTQVDNIMKNFLQMKTPSLFEQFAERAFVEIPEEKTPLDKFIDVDEEKQKKRLSILNESSEFMKKLNDFFDRKPTFDNKTDMYSDIEPSSNDDFALFVPQPSHSQNLNDFSKIIAKQFGPFSGVNFNITTSSKMRFPNGNLRTETVKKIEDGNFEKSITYEVGNKVYTLITITSPSGQQIRRQRKLNFSESELANFKKQWDARYQSDFCD